jgi:hypothetical protein
MRSGSDTEIAYADVFRGDVISVASSREGT